MKKPGNKLYNQLIYLNQMQKIKYQIYSSYYLLTYKNGRL